MEVLKPSFHTPMDCQYTPLPKYIPWSARSEDLCPGVLECLHYSSTWAGWCCLSWSCPCSRWVDLVSTPCLTSHTMSVSGVAPTSSSPAIHTAGRQWELCVEKRAAWTIIKQTQRPRGTKRKKFLWCSCPLNCWVREMWWHLIMAWTQKFLEICRCCRNELCASLIGRIPPTSEIGEGHWGYFCSCVKVRYWATLTIIVS